MLWGSVPMFPSQVSSCADMSNEEVEVMSLYIAKVDFGSAYKAVLDGAMLAAKSLELSTAHRSNPGLLLLRTWIVSDQ